MQRLQQQLLVIRYLSRFSQFVIKHPELTYATNMQKEAESISHPLGSLEGVTSGFVFGVKGWNGGISKNSRRPKPKEIGLRMSVVRKKERKRSYWKIKDVFKNPLKMITDFQPNIHRV